MCMNVFDTNRHHSPLSVAGPKFPPQWIRSSMRGCVKCTPWTVIITK